MTNAAAFKKATSTERFSLSRLLFIGLAILVLAVTGLGWMFVNHQNDEQRDTTGIHLSAACDGKPSTTIERGHVGQLNGQQIRLEQNVDMAMAILSFDGIAEFDTVIASPAGNTINGLDWSVNAVKMGGNGPFVIHSASMNGYDKSVTVC